MCAKTALTYGLLDEKLRVLGFAVRTEKGRARIYKHEPSGASVILPDTRFDDQVLPHHLVVVRRVLADYDLGEFDDGRLNSVNANK
jgi:hypothetical protein